MGSASSFPLEPTQSLRVLGNPVRQDLDRDVAPEPRIARPVDLAHSAGAQRRNHFVRTETRPGGYRHPAVNRGSGIRDLGARAVTGADKLAALDATESARAASLLTDHADLPDAGGQQAVAELQVQPADGDDVGLDHAAAPG